LRSAYDRVHLSSYFEHHDPQQLALVTEGFYQQHHITLLINEKAVAIDRQAKTILSDKGQTIAYDKLIIATGSYPWIPPIKGSDSKDCFVYRTIEDLQSIENCAKQSRSAAVIGGGLL